jgi:vacuolar-type H+-ATPase subunit I/STV1
VNIDDVNRRTAEKAVGELLTAIANEGSEILQVLNETQLTASRMQHLPESDELTDEMVDELTWAVQSTQTELQEARRMLRAASEHLQTIALSQWA